MPDALTVPVGTSLTFRMHPASYDIHTATAGPGNPETEPDSYLGQLAAGFDERRSSTRAAVYPSERAGDAARR